MNCGKEKDDAEKCCPGTCPDIDVPGRPSKVDRSWSEVLRPDNFAHDWDAVTPVEGDSTDLPSARVKRSGYVEDGGNGGIGCQINQTKKGTEDNIDPH